MKLRAGTNHICMRNSNLLWALVILITPV